MNRLWAMYKGVAMGVMTNIGILAFILATPNGDGVGYGVGMIAGFMGAWMILSLRNSHQIYKLVTKKKRPIFIDLNRDITQFLIIQTSFNIILVLLGYEWQLLLIALTGIVLAMVMHDHGKNASMVMGMIFLAFVSLRIELFIDVYWVIGLTCIAWFSYVVFVEYKFRDDWKTFFRRRKLND